MTVFSFSFCLLYTDIPQIVRKMPIIVLLSYTHCIFHTFLPVIFCAVYCRCFITLPSNTVFL